jgi:anti-sigma regulatory factor (Ser/Thr protein kinase)
MRLRFFLDPETNEPHIWDHGVDEDEVEAILRAPGEDRRGSNDSRVAIGQTLAGRYLRVVYVRDPEPDSLFVVTAYELRGQPLTAYQRRQRKKGR